VVGKERLAILRCGELELVVETRGALRVERAWWSPDIGVRIPTSRLVIELPPAPCRGVVRIQRIDRVGATDSTATTLVSAA